jgi:hypothetical protein
MSTKHNKYVVNQKLEPFDDISFNVAFHKTGPIPTQRALQERLLGYSQKHLISILSMEIPENM